MQSTRADLQAPGPDQLDGHFVAGDVDPPDLMDLDFNPKQID